MGYMQHHAIVCSSWDEEHINVAHSIADKLNMSISALGRSKVNGYRSFCVFTDGSKRGWTKDEEGDKARDEFISQLKTRTAAGGFYVDWVEVQYGDDNDVTRVCRNSDESKRRSAKEAL